MLMRSKEGRMKHRKWLPRAVVAVAGCVVSCAVTLQVTRSSADSQGGPRSLAPDLTLGAPLASASLTQDQAVEVALQNHWRQSRFANPVSFQDGSYNDGVFNGQPPRLRDVWQIKITALNAPRSGGRSGAPPPPRIHTLVIYVDDKAGTVLEAQGF